MSTTARTAKLPTEMHPRNGMAARSERSQKAPVGRVLCALCAVALLCLAPLAWAKSDSAPDWVHTAAAQTIPLYPPETNAVVLLDDTTYTVATDGRAVEHHRRVVKILRPQGRDEAVLHVEFDKDTKIVSMHVWSIGPDGHEYAMKDNEYADVGFPGMEGAFEFADDKYRVARAPQPTPAV